MKKRGKKATVNKGKRRYNAISIDAFKNSLDNDWTLLDSRNLSESLTREARSKIRKRARFEIINNPYAHGAALTICNSVAPSIPRLQLSGDVDAELLNAIEDDFYNWSLAVELDEKIRTMRFAKLQDGESFAILHNDETLDGVSDVHLNFTPIDCSRVRSQTYDDAFNPYDKDGVIIDEWGRPSSYTVYDSTEYNAGIGDFKNYPASRVIHWFRRSVPEQFRGLSELSPALLTLAYLRRYSYATIRAAEVAADLALIIKTDDIDAAGDDASSAIHEVTFNRGKMVYLPTTFDATQLKAEQPTSQYSTMIDELLGAVGSSLGLPRLIIRKSAGGFTYASAKVDLSEMERFISIERAEMKKNILNKLFDAFLKEYSLINSLTLPRLSLDWYFEQGIGVKIDPLKEASAIEKRFNCNITTLSREYAAVGLDWQKELEQKAKEAAYIKELEQEYNISLVSEPANSERIEEQDDNSGDN